MVKLLISVKGTGKTKTLLEMVNKAVEETDGSVICIEKGEKLKYDVKHQARLINVSDYNVNNAEALYGMVCGLYAANYDIKHIFIDSALKICDNNIDMFAAFLDLTVKFSEKYNIDIMITSSADASTLPESVKKFL